MPISAMGGLPPPGDVPSPTLAGRFRLEEKLAEDASGELHRATDVESGAAAIVRIVHAESGSARRERLLRETKKAARVSHEGLAVVLEVGQTDAGDMFVAVERIGGERLSDRLRGGAPLAEREAANITGQIARALAAAHDAGVVHRDLRPSLIALSGEGASTRVKVEGLAVGRPASPPTPSSRAAAAVAAAEDLEVAYAAPEHRRGEPVGRRADVYSIGAMLYTMLTGHAPGSGAMEAAEDLGVLGDVVKRCLADDPRDRFLDTIALGAALRVASGSDAPRASSKPPASKRPSGRLSGRPSAQPGSARASVPAATATPALAAAAAPPSERSPPSSHRGGSRPISVRPPSPDSSAAGRAPAAPPSRPLGRPLTARPPWKEALLDLGDGPLPRVAVTSVVAFMIARILTSGFVPFVAAIAAGIAAYATWRRSRARSDR